jgi:hypothetical protein
MTSMIGQWVSKPQHAQKIYPYLLRDKVNERPNQVARMISPRRFAV